MGVFPIRLGFRVSQKPAAHATERTVVIMVSLGRRAEATIGTIASSGIASYP
jgi:hypothetical protein